MIRTVGRALRVLGWGIVAISLPHSLTALQSESAESRTAASGLIAHLSNADVAGTVERVEQAVTSRELLVIQTLDHQAAAERMGHSLTPSTVILFGNPRVGSQLMTCAPSVGIDLPQKLLIWEDANGVVWVGYNDPHWLKDRHAITGCDDVIERVAGVLDAIATEVAGG